MPTTECGFQNSDGSDGVELLARLGPTLPVYVGFDTGYWEGSAPEPELPAERLPALVDTGASNSCIDSELARRLGLPVVNAETIGGVGGVLTVDVYWAQLYVPQLDIGFTGPVAGVHLNAGQQPHQVLIGRDFLRHFTMVYEGRTGSVKITSDTNRQLWRTLWSRLFGDR